MFQRLKVGLALGGGAARGLAHIGALKALEESKIPIHYIAGCSMGAIIGGLYALNPNALSIEAQIQKYLADEVFIKTKMEFLQNPGLENGGGFFYRFGKYIKKKVFYSLSLIKMAFISQEIVEENSRYLFGDNRFNDTKIPFCAVASDINKAEEVILTQGPLGKAVSASCAIPGIMPLQNIDGHVLIDGGCLDLVPIEPVRTIGARYVIAVDVSKKTVKEKGRYETSLDIVLRSGEISQSALFHCQLKKADFILRPPVSSIHWGDFSRSDEAIRLGYESVKQEIPRIKKALLYRRLISIP
ncbi:MAG: patatin-like phospholipase family protein [bacterium]